MKQQYQKPVILVKNNTKQQLAENLSKAAEATVALSFERDALKAANAELRQDNQHLTIQLALLLLQVPKLN